MTRAKICTVFLGTNTMDDDYTFYEDGTVERLYDQSIYSFNKLDKIDAKDIDQTTKEKIIQKCDLKYKKVLSDILFPDDK